MIVKTYYYQGKWITINDIIKLPGVFKTREQIVRDLRRGKSIEESLLQRRCDKREYKHWTVILSKSENHRACPVDEARQEEF